MIEENGDIRETEEEVTVMFLWLKHPWRVMAVVAVLASTTLAGEALAVPLKATHQGTVADCTGPVEWHFVHNRTDATDGVITVGDQLVPNGEPHQANVLHYRVRTAGNVLPTDVADDVADGALVLSDHRCVVTPTTTTTGTTTTTTTTTPNTATTTTTTTPNSPTTTGPPGTVDSVPTTTTSEAVAVLAEVEHASPAVPVVGEPQFTG